MSHVDVWEIIVFAWLTASVYNVVVTLPLFYKATNGYFSSSSGDDIGMLLVSVIGSPTALVVMTIVIIIKAYGQNDITIYDRYEKLVDYITMRR